MNREDEAKAMGDGRSCRNGGRARHAAKGAMEPTQLGHSDRGWWSNRDTHARLVICAGTAAAVLLTSCSNPFGPIDADYDRNLAPKVERLREIQRFEAKKYEDPAPPAMPKTGEKPPSRLAGLESASLTIEQARAAALANNLDIKVVLVDPSISAQSLRAEEAKFEAVFAPNIGYAEGDAPTFDTTASNSQDTARAGAGVSIPMRSGGRATVSFNENFTQTNNPFFALNSAYSPSFDILLTQPLLRNAGRRVNTYSIRIANYNQQITEAGTKLEVIRQLASVDRAYWVLEAVRRELEVRQGEFELAQEQLERARRLVDAGAVGEIEVTRAEDSTASKLEAIITAENAVLKQQRELKRLMNLPDLPLDSATLIVPATQPEPIPFKFDRDQLTQYALANRMEMLELELRLASDYSTIEFAKNQALPSFVLDYRYSIDGLGRTLSDSSDVLYGNKFESWSIGVQGEIPIGNEAAKARVQQAILTRLQRLSTRDARTKAIVQEVLGAIDNLEADWQRILAARQALATAERAYAAEQRQFEVGGNTSIDLLNANSRLADARTAIIRAVANYQISQVDLAFATGTLLGAGHIDWSPLDDSQQPGADPTPPAFPLYSDPQKAMKVIEEGRPLEPGMGH
jgi:outer membrane protein TolC